MDGAPSDAAPPAPAQASVIAVESRAHRELKKPLPVLSFGDLHELVIPERKRLFSFMPEGALVMVHAERGVGKTWFALSLATALASGQSFLKWAVAEPVEVLYIDGEMDLGELRGRARALASGATVPRLHFLSHQYLYDEETTEMDFADGGWQARLEAFLVTHPMIKVVIFDNLSCLLPSTPENKRDDWALTVQPFLLRLRRRGITAILVHHSGRAGTPRGSSAREDQLQAVIRLEAMPKGEDGSGAKFLITFTKSRSAFGAEIEPIVATLQCNGADHATWIWKPAKASNADRLFALVRECNGELTIREAAEALNLGTTTIHALKQFLITEGKLNNGPKLKIAEAFASE
jgi:hypothetical protein